MTKIRTTSFEMKGDYISCNAITLHEDALQDAIVRGMQQVFNTEDSVYREYEFVILEAFYVQR